VHAESHRDGPAVIAGGTASLALEWADVLTLTANVPPGTPLDYSVERQTFGFQGASGDATLLAGVNDASATVSLENTVRLVITPITAGADYTSASGARYSTVADAAPVPEPSTGSLIVIGLGSIAAATRRVRGGRGLGF
jgi:hypothetical protein